MKIACDFVFPYNVPECRKVSEQFRAENLVDPAGPWQEDIIQIDRTILHAFDVVSKLCLGLDTIQVENDVNDEKLNEAVSPVLIIVISARYYCLINMYWQDMQITPLFQDDDTMDIVTDGEQNICMQDTQSVSDAITIDKASKLEKNRQRKQRDKEYRAACASSLSNDSFVCPWCSELWEKSAAVIDHVYDFSISHNRYTTHLYPRKTDHRIIVDLTKSQMKKLKTYHQDDLYKKLLEISSRD
jgi:hypothetical protein